MDKKSKRQEELIRIMQERGMRSVRTLSTILGVSEMTIRRDLDELAARDVKLETTTNAIAQNGDYNFLQALQKANEQKERIGHFAASLIEPNDVIIIDTGSTTAKMLPHIPSDKNLTVLSYNANVLVDLRYKPGLQLLFCGGVYHQNTEMFESPESIQFIERTRANKVFLSAAGVHKELGITCANTHEVPTKIAVIRSSQQRILLVDSNKFDQVRSSHFCDMDCIHTIVTDKNLSQDWQNRIHNLGIELHLV